MRIGQQSRESRNLLIDIFSILLTHGLILLVCWRLMWRDDLDADEADQEPSRRPWLRDERQGTGTADDA